MPREGLVGPIGMPTGSCGTRTQIMPPDDLNPLEKTEFIDVVLGSPANHFLPADIAMISLYVRHTVGERIRRSASFRRRLSLTASRPRGWPSWWPIPA